MASKKSFSKKLTKFIATKRVSSAKENRSSARKFERKDELTQVDFAKDSNSNEKIASLFGGSLSVAASIVPAISNIAIRNIGSTVTNEVKAEALTINGSVDRESIVRSFVESAKTLTNVNKKDIRNVIVASFSSLKTSDRKDSNQIQISSPTLDRISVGFDRKKGIVDGFFSKVLFSVPVEQIRNGTVKLFKIYRMKTENKSVFKTRDLSMIGAGVLSSDKSTFRRKNNDTMSIVEKRFNESNVGNAVTKLSRFDKFENIRLSSTENNFYKTINSNTVLDSGSNVVKKNLISFGIDENITMDRTVSSDIKSIKNLKNIINEKTKVVIKNEGIDSFESQVITDDNALQKISNTRQNFREIAVLHPGLASSGIIGDFAMFEFFDDSVTYGNSYSYYVVSVGKDSFGTREKIRSKIVTVHFDGLRAVNEIDSVEKAIIDNSVALTIFSSDQFVEKYEIFRKEHFKYTSENNIEYNKVSTNSGYNSSIGKSSKVSSGFRLVSEVVNSVKRGTTFVDRTVVPGKKYTYRLYAIDIFGNKSSGFKQLDASVDVDGNGRNFSIERQSISVEKDSKTEFAKIRINASNNKITSMLLDRKDLTLKQKAFTVPHGENRLVRSNGNASKGPHSFTGERIYDADKNNSWTGYFENTGKEIVFFDKTVQSDHSYVYRIRGFDKFGNESSCNFSNIVNIDNIAYIEAPINLSATLKYDENENINKVELVWEDPNIDKTSEDFVGSRDSLTDTSVRTLYQVDRKLYGESVWKEFSLLEERKLVDDVFNEIVRKESPRGPENVVIGQKYAYRVRSIQTGSYQSNYSDEISINVDARIYEPKNFLTTIQNVKQDPINVLLTWDTDERSAIIDKWEIERAAVNNIAAKHIFDGTILIDKLIFEKFKVIGRESCRCLSFDLDSTRRDIRELRLDIGEHRSFDFDVSPGNTYIYRIRAFSPFGLVSDWSVSRISIIDADFDRKLSSILGTDKIVSLAKSIVPIKLNIYDGKFMKKNTF